MGLNANAQLLDAIRGHAQDLRVRFDDHQKIEGELIKRCLLYTSPSPRDS